MSTETKIYKYGTQITDFSNNILAKENERINNIEDTVNIRAETYDRQKSFQKSGSSL